MGNAYYQDQVGPAFWGDSSTKQPSKGQKKDKEGIPIKTDAKFQEVQQSELPSVGGRK